jgi:hypothetical protein
MLKKYSNIPVKHNCSFFAAIIAKQCAPNCFDTRQYPSAASCKFIRNAEQTTKNLFVFIGSAKPLHGGHELLHSALIIIARPI